MPRPEQSLPCWLPSPPITSDPEGHSWSEQSGPRKPRSHLQPTCFSESQGVVYIPPASAASCFSVKQKPLPEQSFGQTVRSHATPS